MKLSTGKVEFPIEFDNGDEDVVYFNPNDPEFVMRINKFQENFVEKTKSIEDVELSKDGTPRNKSQIDVFEKMQNILKEELDYVFGSSISNVVFKHCSPFAIVDGQYFVLNFIEAIKPEVKKCVEKSNQELKEKMSKHLDKYKK